MDIIPEVVFLYMLKGFCTKRKYGSYLSIHPQHLIYIFKIKELSYNFYVKLQKKKPILK